MHTKIINGSILYTYIKQCKHKRIHTSKRFQKGGTHNNHVQCITMFRITNQKKMINYHKRDRHGYWRNWCGHHVWISQFQRVQTIWPIWSGPIQKHGTDKSNKLKQLYNLSKSYPIQMPRYLKNTISLMLCYICTNLAPLSYNMIKQWKQGILENIKSKSTIFYFSKISKTPPKKGRSMTVETV